jgi:hypothetical protein
LIVVVVFSLISMNVVVGCFVLSEKPNNYPRAFVDKLIVLSYSFHETAPPPVCAIVVR